MNINDFLKMAIESLKDNSLEFNGSVKIFTDGKSLKIKLKEFNSSDNDLDKITIKESIPLEELHKLEKEFKEMIDAEAEKNLQEKSKLKRNVNTENEVLQKKATFGSTEFRNNIIKGFLIDVLSKEALNSDYLKELIKGVYDAFRIKIVPKKDDCGKGDIAERKDTLETSHSGVQLLAENLTKNSKKLKDFADEFADTILYKKIAIENEMAKKELSEKSKTLKEENDSKVKLLGKIRSGIESELEGFQCNSESTSSLRSDAASELHSSASSELVNVERCEYLRDYFIKSVEYIGYKKFISYWNAIPEESQKKYKETILYSFNEKDLANTISAVLNGIKNK